MQKRLFWKRKKEDLLFFTEQSDFMSAVKQGYAVCVFIKQGIEIGDNNAHAEMYNCTPFQISIMKDIMKENVRIM